MRKVTLGWATGKDGTLRKFSLKAPTLDLNTVRAVSSSMPLDTAVLRRCARCSRRATSTTST